MREILFRGKRIDNGEWVEGSLVVTSQDGSYIISTAENKRDATVLVNQCSLNVDPETIGQFTGLTNKNGIKIFEGDIVSLAKYGGPTYKVVYELCRYELVNSKGINCFVLDIYKSEDIEVIGNIHDNPELLGKTENP